VIQARAEGCLGSAEDGKSPDEVVDLVSRGMPELAFESQSEISLTIGKPLQIVHRQQEKTGRLMGLDRTRMRAFTEQFGRVENRPFAVSSEHKFPPSELVVAVTDQFTREDQGESFGCLCLLPEPVPLIQADQLAIAAQLQQIALRWGRSVTRLKLLQRGRHGLVTEHS